MPWPAWFETTGCAGLLTMRVLFWSAVL